MADVCTSSHVTRLLKDGCCMQVPIAVVLATKTFSARLLQTTHSLLPLLPGTEICCFTLRRSYVKFFALWKLEVIRKVCDTRSAEKWVSTKWLLPHFLSLAPHPSSLHVRFPQQFQFCPNKTHTHTQSTYRSPSLQ